MRIALIALAACAALLVSSKVFAEPKEFAKVDVNGDASVDAAEYAESGSEEKTFEELDKNKDGRLSEEEYSVVLEECE